MAGGDGEPRVTPWDDKVPTSGHEDPELRKWLLTIVHDNMAGDFLKLLAMAALLEISKRYPKYNE